MEGSRWKVQSRGGRVATKVTVRDMNLAVPNARDAERLVIVADALPFLGGAQLAGVTTVSLLQCDGPARCEECRLGWSTAGGGSGQTGADLCLVGRPSKSLELYCPCPPVLGQSHLRCESVLSKLGGGTSFRKLALRGVVLMEMPSGDTMCWMSSVTLVWGDVHS